jgi:uncharacterized protein YjbI with pentapeptide repeats
MLFQSRLRTLFCAAVTLIIVVLGISVLDISTRVNSILSDAEGAFRNLNLIAADFREADLSGMFSEMNVLIEDGQGVAAEASLSMAKAVEKIESLDIEKLNQSIRDFAAVIEPLANFFGR